ncbi:BREX system ATP-binding domain-containing protein [Micromonospora sediminimaris]|uniref:AAA+ ATPase domain-containing protein n=1 Tax=Micromonospora sediminimaris TaxID=547162 RepID=A0A9W5UPY3_9ACTN|nr:BREX system ATP-binding domain-containing protein [Micromonospora sediminimaris]GIJ33027.1 hypothetical protein Vse01_21750 [Micromonospora sediminimaris]SFD12796.1 P-loop protein of unknown function [Micromonospora sediminimaris]
MDAEDLDLTGEVNPFPSSAVAQIADGASTVFTIETPAIRRALRAMDTYLAGRADDPRVPSGQVVAVVGDYGTGKTHLAAHLIRYATEQRSGGVQSMHLNAPPDTFISLYRAFADRLAQRRELVHDRVRRYYAEIVADELRASEATLPLAEKLAAGHIDPVRAVDRLSLFESEFLLQLRERLRQVTGNVEFSQALTLLLRGGFEDAVWEWFSGRPPADVLRERGITGTITSSETTALQAMGVFALLIGHGSHPFVVVIDELDQLLTAAGRHEDEALDAFKEMLRVFAASNTFLLLAGLPDLLSNMRRDVRDRIDEQIVMSPLTAVEVQAYVRNRQRGRLAPFTEQTLAYVAELANGVPRGIISLCHRLWRRARDQRSTVTHPMVRQEARELYDSDGTVNVRDEIRQVLVASGYDNYVPGYFVGGTEDTRVDYWVPVGSQGAGCGVLLAEPMLDEFDLATVQQRGRAVRSQTDCELLLVVLGPFPDRFREQLLDAIGREPLAYRQRSFPDHFAVEFKAMAARLEERYTAEGPLATLSPQLARLDRRQSATQHMITLLTGSLDDLRGHYDQQLTAIQRELHEIQRGGIGDRQGHASVVTTLPQPVVQLFDDAFGSVDLMTSTRELLRRTFHEGESGRTARQSVRARIGTSQVQAATGVTALLNALIEAFGHALVDWYRTATSTTDGRLAMSHRERLDDLCKVFDVVYGYLPLYELRALREMVGYPGAGSQQQQEAEEVLSDFSARVHHELLAPFGTAEH